MKVNSFILRFFILIILIGGIVGTGIFLFMDQVLAKSFYYKFGDSELVSVLATGRLDMSRDTLTLQLDDTLLQCSHFNKSNPAANVFNLSSTNGDTIAMGAGMEALSSRFSYVIKKAPDLGVRRIHSEKQNQLVVQIRSSVELVWVEDPLTKPDEQKGISHFDEHWYLRKKPVVQP